MKLCLKLNEMNQTPEIFEDCKFINVMGNDRFMITIFEEVGGNSAISVDDGTRVYHKIDAAISDGLTITLDFQDIDLIIAAFLNAAIGQLYSKYSSEYLKSLIELKNVKPCDARLFKKVIERAGEFNNNPIDFENTTNDIFYNS